MQELRLAPAPSQLEALRSAGESIFDEPLTVTHEYILIDGYKRLAIAQERGIRQVYCVVRTMTADDALTDILQKSKSRSWINAFTRVQLAMFISGPLSEKGREHQQRAGREKHLSKLTRAERINVRAEIARRAGVSEGTVRKVGAIAERGIDALQSACRIGAISIHAAYRIALEGPDEQLRVLTRHETMRRERQRRHALARRTNPLHKAKAGLNAECRAVVDRLKSAEQLEQFRAHLAQFSAPAEAEAHDSSAAGPKAA
ncbi:MAG: hypothetical protein ACLGSH_06065 [Acidobacteriota bacterium]